MSFSSVVKNELSHIDNERECCRIHQLAGAIRAGLVLRQEKGELRLMMSTESAALSRILYTYFKELFGKTIHVLMKRTQKFKKHIIYILDFTEYSKQYPDVMEKLGISMDWNKGQISFVNLSTMERCCMRAYLRGVFMSTGSIIDPDKAYHLEITCHYLQIGHELVELINKFDLNPKIIRRKEYHVVYLKEGQDIVDFLNITGAHHALMELENIRILKDMRNRVNRIVNCETANLEKTVNASFRQVENIRIIRDKIGLENLPVNLREIARLRLEYSDVSLSELGKMLSPPLSKSGANHRLRKLDGIADKIKEESNRP